MDPTKMSGLRFYSLGIVLENKKLDEDMIEVDPIEDFTLDEGKIVKDDRKFDVSLPDHKDRVKKSKIEGGSMLKAKWIPFGHSNRDTAPDVRKNETVLLFRFADEQEYYWTTIMREPEIRRLERVRYSYSNKPDGLEPYDDDSSYYLEVSTVDQQILIHTSDNNGEVCKYDIKIDAKAGRINIKDDLGNSIELRSPEGELETTTTSKFIVNTRQFIVNATESTTFVTPLFTMVGTHHEVIGDIHATETIIDDCGNTNHHGH